MTQKLALTLSATASITCTLLGLPLAHAQDLSGSYRARVAAEPGDFSLKVEPGLAFALSRPQSELFELGVGQTIKGLFSLTPWLDIGPSVSFLTLPSEDGQGEAGTSWTLGGGLRIKRVHDVPDDDDFAAMSPWLDVDVLYARTGDLNRPALAGAVGLAIPVGDDRAFWIGPFARYLHILQGTRTGFDNADAKILSIGLSLEWGPDIEREPEVASRLADVAPHPEPVAAPAIPCPDRDQDGLLDAIDQCPDVAGPPENKGCRTYQKIVVEKDKLVLKERLYFAWNQATLQPESHAVLDEVVLALNDNKNFRVQVEGHTSSEGTHDHNQTLSEARAAAVLDYLVAHGIAKDRLVSKGFASSVPTDTNDTAAGRDNNRRVEFVVNFIILDGGTK